MYWIIFTLLAALIWAIVNIVDKHVVSKWVREPLVPVIILGIIEVLSGVVIYFTQGFSEISLFCIGIAFVAGIFEMISVVFYFKAIKLEEVSRVVPLFLLTPLFILILAAIFLGEIFTPIKYLGIFILLIGAVLIISRKSLKMSLGKAFWFMIAACFTYSIFTVITKYLLNFSDFWTVFAYIRIGSIFALIPIMYFGFKELRRTVEKFGIKVLGLITVNESMNFVALVCITLAISLGPVTLTEALASFQYLFLLVLATLVSIFFPKIIKEDISKENIIQKFIAIILMFIGAYLIM